MLSRLIGVITAVAISTSAFAADITGAGATFPYPIYSKWSDEYKKVSGNQLNYQSIGSGAGIKQIEAKTVTFGASDMPLKPEDLEKKGLVQFPTVIGGVVPIINLDGIESGQLVLDGETLAQIYLGKITSWDDAKIAALNPKAKLPKLPITVVRRSDGSGTTFIFTNYLSKVSKDWKDTIGEGSAVEFPVGIGAKGNDGVSNNVKQTKGAIGYVEYAYAKQNKIAYTSLINSAKKTVAPNSASFQAAASSVGFDAAQGFYAILTNTSSPEAWPISGATFIIMQKVNADKVAAKDALKFFDWAYKNGDKMAEELDYVPLPKSVKESVVKSWSKID